MDRLLEENLNWPARWPDWSESELGLPVDLRETDGHLVLSADLPGLKPEEVDISLRRNTLTIKGEYQSEDTRDDENVYYRERRYGKFHRSLELPTEVEADAIEAEFEDGVLKVIMPKVEEAQAKRIEVKATA
jgi:HSP20 family protein